MSSSRREHPSTYFVQDRGNQEELARLQLQDRLVTQRMGGVLSEQVDPPIFRRVLDIGCGTGGWLIDMAKAYPGITQLFGVDISGKVLDYARAQAEADQVSDRVEFLLMDALRMLEFPTSFFDLVNTRFASSFLRKWDWLKFLQEAQRVCKPGGVIRATEAGVVIESSSPALNRINHILVQASHQAGHSFAPDGDGVAAHLVGLMHQYGVQHIQTRTYTIESRAGTPEGQLSAEDRRLVYRTALPFMRKWTRVPDDYEDIYQQMLVETQAPDFVATWQMLTAWGTNEGH